ncbi:MAG: helicase HerA domain-containing protein [Candidatus Woesearchaeota archaeon]
MDNTIYTILGKKGSGKSYLTAQIIQYFYDHNLRDHIILLDNSKDYITDKNLNFLSYLEIEKIKDQYKKFNLLKFINQYQHSLLDFSGLTRSKFYEISNNIAEQIYNKTENILLIVDECYMFLPKGQNKENSFEQLISGGRKKGIDQIYITQRAQQMNLLIYDQTDYLISFRMQEDRSIKKIRKFFPEIKENYFRNLGERECIVYNGKEIEKKDRNELMFDN